MTKIEALANHLGCEADELSTNDDEVFDFGRQEYFVLNDLEADEKTKEYILDSLWAFNAEFIANHTSVNLSDRAIKALAKMQSELCEDANDLVAALIKDLDYFVQAAIRDDGRGHFLAGYDFEENEEGGFYIYRTN